MAEGYPAPSAEEPEIIEVAWSDGEGLVTPEIPEIPENIELGQE